MNQPATPGADVPSLGSFDHVIIGAGTAGCLLANRLSADPAVKVALLEAGGRDRNLWIHIPVGYLYCINNKKLDWCFRTEPEPGLGGRTLGYPRGRVLGGCSSINGMIYMRGQARDYDQWRQLGNVGWSWNDVLPYFRRSEDFFAGADAAHGMGGEWRVENQRLSWEILDAFRDAAASCGIPPVTDFNRGDNAGCGYFHVNQRRGVRWNTAKAFLHPVAKRPNLAVFTHAQVQHLLLEDGRVVGAALRQNGVARRIAATRGVVLAAGAIGSPHLLHLSGIGPAEVLRQAGLAVRHHLPGVGENLQDHLQLRLAYRVQGVATLNQQAARRLGRLGIALHYAALRRGPMSMAPSQLGAFARSDPAQDTPDLQYHVQPLSLDRFGEPLHRFPAFTASVCHLRPSSRGFVRATTPDPMAPPAIQPRYLSDPQDRVVAARAIRLTRRICAAPALARYQPQEFMPGPATGDDDAALVAAAGVIGTTIFHPVGTCRMGDDPLAVVDARLAVHGLAGLHIADASVMPRIISGNTNSPTLMIAERAAELIGARSRNN